MFKIVSIKHEFLFISILSYIPTYVTKTGHNIYPSCSENWTKLHLPLHVKCLNISGSRESKSCLPYFTKCCNMHLPRCKGSLSTVLLLFETPLPMPYLLASVGAATMTKARTEMKWQHVGIRCPWNKNKKWVPIGAMKSFIRKKMGHTT